MKSVAMIYLSNYQNWPMGGMLNYVKNLIPTLKQEMDWNVEFWGGTVDGKHCKIDAFESEKLNIYTDIHVINKIIPNFINSFFGVLKNKKQFQKYEIIYSHTSATTIALKLCFPKTFVVHHQHGLSYKDNHGVRRVLNLGYTIAQILADMTLFVASKDEVKRHKKFFLFRKKIFYPIGSPIDFKYIYNELEHKDEKVVRFIYTGRLDGWKNVEFLIEAFKIFHEQDEKSELIIIGDGPDYYKLVEIITKIQAEDYIKILGRMEHRELVKELKKSNVFLFPSKGEGISLSILEALAAGLPVVGFDVRGVRDLVIKNKTGILVKKMDCSSFAEGIKQSSQSYTKLSRNCVKLAEQYDAECVTHSIIDLIMHEQKKQQH